MKVRKEYEATAAEINSAAKRVYHGQLTGQSRYRISFFGKVVLQLEHYIVKATKHRGPLSNYTTYEFKGRRWRDACREDMRMEIGLGQIILEGLTDQLLNY